METPTSKNVFHSESESISTLFYDDPGVVSEDSLFDPYFFIVRLERDHSFYGDLFILFNDEMVRNIDSDTSFTHIECPSHVREDCIRCKSEDSLYELRGLGQQSIVSPFDRESLRTLRLCGDCFEIVRRAVSDHVSKNPEIIQYEL